MSRPEDRAKRAFVKQPDKHGPDQIAGSDFVIEIRAVGARFSRSGRVRGRDTYGLSAVIAVQALRRLLGAAGLRSGALSAAEAFEASSFLDSLRGGVSYEMDQVAAAGQLH